jgi:tetratricopeptide (TPR) repeat protein
MAFEPMHLATLNSPSSVDCQASQTLKADVITLLRHKVSCHVQAGHYAGAISLLKTLIQQNPCSAIDYNNRGFVYLKLQDMAAAIADFDRAIQLDPYLDRAYNNRGNYYALQGQLQKALQDYTTAIRLNPKNVKAWLNQGITLRDMGLYGLAIESFDCGLYLGQWQGHLYAERGRTHHLAGDWNWAIADYRKALNLIADQESGAEQLRQRIETWLKNLLVG